MSETPLPLFDEATEVRPGDEAGVWVARLRDEFTIVNGHPNGGYLLAILGRAAVAEVGARGETDRHVVAATATYVSAPVLGPTEVHTTVLRQGRTASQVRAQLVQEGRVAVDVVMTLGAIADEPVRWGGLDVVDMPDEPACRAAMGERTTSILGGDAPPLAKVLRCTFDPAVLSFAKGEPSGSGELRAWLALADGRPWDPASLLFAIDALPPATFEVAITGWVPTLSLTAYIRGLPAPGPLAVRFRAQQIAGGFADEVCDVWDSAGRLVATSTQLAAIRLP